MTEAMRKYLNSEKGKETKKLNYHKYEKTMMGVIKRTYTKQNTRRKTLGYKLGYSREYLTDFLLKSRVFKELFDAWVISGYKTALLPTVDRIDCFKGYEIGNIQVITWEENRLKGYKETLLKLGKKVNQYDLSGNFIATHPSIKEAGESINLKPGNISCALTRRQKTAGGYKWEYAAR